MPKSPPRVLVVDDDENTVQILNSFLSSKLFDVWGVATATEALEVLDSSPPDVLVLDLRLPDGHGFEVMRRLANGRGRPRIPVICFTGVADAGSRQEAEALGCSAYIAKPASPRDVVAAVIRSLGEREDVSM